MTTNLEVLFCDLCNESVPQTDIDSGRAQRIKGRLIGGCCAAVLRRAPERAVDRRAGVASAVVGMIVLGGVAAGAAFIDWRLSQEADNVATRLHGVEERGRLGQERLVTLEEAVTQIGARLDFDGLSRRIDALDSRLEQLRSSADGRSVRIEEALQAATASQRNAFAEQREGLAGLQASLQAVSTEVAALRAKPNAAPKAAEPMEEPPATPRVSAPAEPDLPPELKHQVLALADDDPGTRFSAVDNLLRSRDVRVLPALLPMAKDANTFVRRLTVEGLRDFRRAESVEVLLVALADPEPIVRLTAHASLRALTAQRFDFDDASPTTRATAQRRWQEWWEKNRASFTF